MLDILVLGFLVLLYGVLWRLYAVQHKQLQEALAKVEALMAQVAMLPRSEAILAIPPLEPIRVAIAIEQDHKLPILSNLIKERLEADDGMVTVIDADQASTYADLGKWSTESGEPHVVVAGNVKCNGYSDVFYEADLTFLYARGIVDSILENPPNGGRQVNLANKVVSRLKRTYEESSRKAERNQALHELNS